MSWTRSFDDPIPTPKGKPLLTLKDAAAYILKLPKREAAAEHWQIAMEQLIDCAEGRNFLLHARIGMLRALNHGKPDPVPMPRAQAREGLQDREIKRPPPAKGIASGAVPCSPGKHRTGGTAPSERYHRHS
jgi:hypothetical protein